MNLKRLASFILLSSIVWTAIASAVGPDEVGTMAGSDQAEQEEVEPDWLNPFYSGRPEWDPYGPGQDYDYIPDRPDWDPYAPSGGGVSYLVSADPISSGLAIASPVLGSNQLYLQSDGVLVTSGTVNLGESYALWLYVANWGPFALYDRSRVVVSENFLTPGWYKVDRYAEILSSHFYQFNATGWSNNVTVLVSSAGYPLDRSLVGRVVDQYGNGVPGAKVSITGVGGGYFSTTADSRGYYGLNVPTGTYTVTAELGGYRFTQATARVWMGTVSVAGKVVGYPAGYAPPTQTGPYPGGMGWLEGSVTEKSGKAISGARVTADGFASVLTDAQGRYSMGLGPGWYTIDVEAEGYIFRPATVRILSGEVTHVDFKGRTVLILGTR